jgi:hypothetical protein
MPYEAWEHAKIDLEHCISYHPICRVPNPTFTPKRLIEIKGSVGATTLRLVELRNGQSASNASTQYCALSYCWGAISNTVITTRESLKNHIECLEIRALPQVCIPLMNTQRKTDVSIQDSSRCHSYLSSFRYTISLGRCFMYRPKRY